MLDLPKRCRYAEINSKLLRRLFSLYYKDGRVYPILFGPLRGMRIRYYRHVNFHTLLGFWELRSLEFLARVLTKSGISEGQKIFYDMGANLGVYSLWFSRLAPKGKVYAFEPAPTIAALLRDNLRLNRISQVEVVELACADQVGPVEFFEGEHHHTSSLNEDIARSGKKVSRKITVQTTTLDDFIYGEKKHPPPDLVKMDIEGGGVYALKGCDRCVKEKRPLFFVESHFPAEDRAISDLLVKHDYQAYRLNNQRWVENLKETHPHPKGVWGNLFLCPGETRQRFSRILS